MTEGGRLGLLLRSRVVSSCRHDLTPSFGGADPAQASPAKRAPRVGSMPGLHVSARLRLPSDDRDDAASHRQSCRLPRPRDASAVTTCGAECDDRRIGLAASWLRSRLGFESASDRTSNSMRCPIRSGHTTTATIGTDTPTTLSPDAQLFTRQPG